MRAKVLLLAGLLALGAAAATSDDAADTAAMATLVVDPEDRTAPLAVIPVNDDLETAKRALDAIKNFVEIFNSDIFEAVGVKQVAEIITKVFSFVISIINLIQGVENAESAEMIFLREQFAEVNARLDGISLKLDEVMRLIEWRTTRVMYADCEIFIVATSSLYFDYLKANADDRDIFKRRFVDAYRSKRLAAQQLHQAIVEMDFVIADNLAAAVVHYTQNHRRNVMNFLLAMNRLIMRGAQLEIAYERLEHGEYPAKVVETVWGARMEKLVTKMKEVDTEVMDAWHTQAQTDVTNILLEQRALSNKDFSVFVYKFLAEKFYWRYWFSLAYNEVSGHDLHSISSCGFHRFREHGRNIAVSSANPKSARFTKANGERILELAESAGHWTTDASIWTKEIRARAGIGCDEAAFVGAICWGCDVWYTARSDRYAYRKINVAGNVNAIVFG